MPLDKREGTWSPWRASTATSRTSKAIDLVKANAVVVEKKAEEEQTEEKKPAKKRASAKKEGTRLPKGKRPRRSPSAAPPRRPSAEEKTEG